MPRPMSTRAESASFRNHSRASATVPRSRYSGNSAAACTRGARSRARDPPTCADRAKFTRFEPRHAAAEAPARLSRGSSPRVETPARLSPDASGIPAQTPHASRDPAGVQVGALRLVLGPSLATHGFPPGRRLASKERKQCFDWTARCCRALWAHVRNAWLRSGAPNDGMRICRPFLESAVAPGITKPGKRSGSTPVASPYLRFPPRLMANQSHSPIKTVAEPFVIVPTPP